MDTNIFVTQNFRLREFACNDGTAVPEHPVSNHAGYIFEHRLIMEEFLGRYLTVDEIVHHINKNVADNRIENLLLFNNLGEHTKYHNFERNKA